MNYEPQMRISTKMRITEMYVDAYTKNHGKPPSYRQVKDHFGLKGTAAAHARLRHCREKMAIKKEKLIVIELSDNEIKLVTPDELRKMEATAMEFDGFYGWIVRGKLCKC